MVGQLVAVGDPFRAGEGDELLRRRLRVFHALRRHVDVRLILAANFAPSR